MGVVIAFTASCIAVAAHAGPGLVDTGFGTQGTARIVFPGGNDQASAMAIQAEGGKARSLLG